MINIVIYMKQYFFRNVLKYLLSKTCFFFNKNRKRFIRNVCGKCLQRLKTKKKKPM